MTTSITIRIDHLPPMGPVQTTTCTVESNDNDINLTDLANLIRQCCAGAGYDAESVNRVLGEMDMNHE